jgi:hypothetical protein
MNPEDRAWTLLHERAAAQLSPGFAQRVLVAARAVASAPSILGQFTLGLATAALCFLAVTLYQSQRSSEENHNLADWQQITSATDEASLGQ